MVLFPGVKSQACGSVTVQCWVAGSAPRLNPTHCYTTLEKKKKPTLLSHYFQKVKRSMALRSYSSCERQNLHFQSQVLATIMHRCRDPPCHVAVCQSPQPGRLCLRLWSKLLQSSGLLLILQQLGGWLWVGYEDSELKKQYWLLILRLHEVNQASRARWIWEQFITLFSEMKEQAHVHGLNTWDNSHVEGCITHWPPRPGKHACFHVYLCSSS